MASTIPPIEPVAIIGKASFGPKPFTDINFKNSSYSSLILKPNNVCSSSLILYKHILYILD